MTDQRTERRDRMVLTKQNVLLYFPVSATPHITAYYRTWLTHVISGGVILIGVMIPGSRGFPIMIHDT